MKSLSNQRKHELKTYAEHEASVYGWLTLAPRDLLALLDELRSREEQALGATGYWAGWWHGEPGWGNFTDPETT